ncbi:MAG: dienelactone hydrolase family protein [Betaproteobacteria bacterium]|jgi:carboxymethylenebutenolidase|nr:dienelactone hydrolase family protein [Betaproteobacteria bacterium]MEA3152551.1 carboxymethylenebutenolidase [Betaproteobacteria bacterium]
MALLEKEVVVTTKHGRMPAFAACPDAPGAFPGIILYMDAPGFREELCNMARRIARHGYFCLLPDMYYRYGTIRFDTPRRSDAMSAVIKAAYTSLTNADVSDDTAGLLAFLDAQDKVTPGPVGCVGYCMSGQFVTTVAARFAHRFAAVGSLYGVKIVTDQPDSPHLLIDQIKGELFYGFAETDPSVPENVIPTLTAALKKAGVKHHIKVFERTQHGFCFPERQVYAAAASEQTWTILFDLWDRNLKKAEGSKRLPQ